MKSVSGRNKVVHHRVLIIADALSKKLKRYSARFSFLATAKSSVCSSLHSQDLAPKQCFCDVPTREILLSQ